VSKNFARTAVAVAPSPATSGATLTVTSGHGVRLYVGTAVLHPADAAPTPANAEVVAITDVTGDVVTITRAQESSTARTVVVGDVLTQGITAGGWDALVAASTATVPLVRGGTGATTAAGARTALGLGTAATMTPATIAADPAVTSTYARLSGLGGMPSADAICMGDSITAYGGSDTMAPSWFNQLCIRSLGRLRWRGIYATGGFKIADLVSTHMPTVLALTPRPGSAFIMIGANDCSENVGVGFDLAAKSAAYVSGVIEPLLAAGIRPVPVMVTPNDGAVGGLPAITANVDLWNAWLRRYCLSRGLLCLDANSPLVDTDGSMQVAFRLNGTDRVHPGPLGHKAISEFSLPAVRSAFPAQPLGASMWAESRNLLGDGTFRLDSNADGLADGWSVGGSPTGFARSLITPTAGDNINGRWQQVTRASTDTTSGWVFKQINSGWSVGDVLEYSIRIQAEGYTGSGATWSSYVKPGNLSNSYGAVNAWSEDITDGLLSVRFAVPVGATSLYCYAASLTAPTSGTTRFRTANATLRNLTTLGIAAL